MEYLDRTDIETVAQLRWCLAHCQSIPEDLASDIYSTVWELLNEDERAWVAVNSRDSSAKIPREVNEVMVLMLSTFSREHIDHYLC